MSERTTSSRTGSRPSKRRREANDDTSPRLEPALIADLVDGLRGWYFTRRRQLPWRDEPSAYRVWVSEIMLQQTQVATVIPYFERFIGAFPTVSDLAAADEEQVLGLWAGLGYYRRARNLHAGARRVVAELGGLLPSTVDGLMSVPGIGRYTAGAIASIAFGVRAPLLDGNVARVLSRLFGMGEPADAASGQKKLWALAEALVPADDPSSHNQALMELGALVCAPKSPDCERCPVSDRCRARALGSPTAFPVKRPKAAPQPMAAVGGLCLRRGEAGLEVLLARRPDGLLGGLWELPGGEIALEDEAEAESRARLEALYRERVGLSVAAGPRLASVHHQFSHRTLTLHLHRVTPRQKRATREPLSSAHYRELRWVPRRVIAESVALSTLTRKVLSALRTELEADDDAVAGAP